MLIEELIEKAFCEGYEYAQKEYARRDYEGLSEKAANKLREDRKKIADWTREQRKRGIKTINRGKQVKTRIEVESPSGVYKKSTTKNATCENDGYVIYVCENDSHHTTKETLPAFGHNYVLTVKEPTCILTGYTLHTCTNCNDTYKCKY